jgi:hypothetical protein
MLQLQQLTQIYTITDSLLSLAHLEPIHRYCRLLTWNPSTVTVAC